jgi:hypothetical protein
MFIKIPFEHAWLIRVAIEEKESDKDSLFLTQSPELPGMFVSARSLGEEFSNKICSAITEMLTAMGQEPPVNVIRVNHPDRETGYWHFVAIPQRLLQSMVSGD